MKQALFLIYYPKDKRETFYTKTNHMLPLHTIHDTQDSLPLWADSWLKCTGLGEARSGGKWPRSPLQSELAALSLWGVSLEGDICPPQYLLFSFWYPGSNSRPHTCRTSTYATELNKSQAPKKNFKQKYLKNHADRTHREREASID